MLPWNWISKRVACWEAFYSDESIPAIILSRRFIEERTTTIFRKPRTESVKFIEGQQAPSTTDGVKCMIHRANSVEVQIFRIRGVLFRSSNTRCTKSILAC